MQRYFSLFLTVIAIAMIQCAIFAVSANAQGVAYGPAACGPSHKFCVGKCAGKCCSGENGVCKCVCGDCNLVNSCGGVCQKCDHCLDRCGSHCACGGKGCSICGHCPCSECCGGCGCCYGGCIGDGLYMRPVERAKWYNWNRNYAYTDYGQTTALVVPPTANMQTNWGWGVASSRISRIDHQFQRNYPGTTGGGTSFGGPTFGGPARPTPVWPSDTNEFGVYYVRGPW